MLTLAAFSGASDVLICWIYIGRKNEDEMNIVGVVYSELPAALHISDGLLMTEAIEDIREQIEKGITYSKYPYLRYRYPRVVVDDQICIMYQENLYDFNVRSKYDFEAIEIEQKDRASQNLLDIEIVDDDDSGYLLMDYSAKFYKKETIESYGRMVSKIAKKIACTKDFCHMTVWEFLAGM